MSGEFLDSNVVLYTIDDQDIKKQRQARALVTDSIRSGLGVISWQVVQEVLNVVTTKLESAAGNAEAKSLLDDVLFALWRIHPTVHIYERALEIRSRYGFGYYDSLIVSAALTDDCGVLWTEGLQDGQVIEGLTIRSPFT